MWSIPSYIPSLGMIEDSVLMKLRKCGEGGGDNVNDREPNDSSKQPVC
jgi:hypothetical protein